MEAKKEIHLNVNGREYIISNAAPDLYLTDWLRDKIHLKGVKKQCGEGGCGSCVVAISKEDPISHPESILAINSCMQPVICLDGCHVITVEGIGNKKNGFNIIQERFAENFASQCGFCTPGFIMNGYSYLANSCNSKSPKDIENCMDGNICRCTGYRPIIDAMKSFSGESAAVDIEDLRKIKICPKNCIQPKPKTIDIDTPVKSSWYDPRSLEDLFATLQKLRGETIKLISGSTGMFKNETPAKAYIGLRNVKELNEIKASENEIEIGAGVTLTALIQFLQKNFPKSETFSVITEHLQKVASTPVRNAATWAGNLMLLNMDNSFPSDVFIIFSTIDAKLTIADFVDSKKTYSMQEFFTLDMSCKVILSAALPVCKEEGTLRTFTVMPRKQNTYGYVNAGFHAKFDKGQSTFKSKPRIIFGGVGLKMVRATELEDFLEGKHLNGTNVFLDGVKLLRNCLSENPKNKLVDFKYCKDVAVNLFYKFWVSLCEDNAKKRSLSAITNFVPVESTGSQSFHVSEDENAAVNKPFIRVEGKMHASGEAQYVGDIPPMQNEVYAAFVLSTVASATLENINAAEAESHPGFIALITAKDVPGVNNWRNNPCSEEIFTTKEISYHGQPVALVVADSQQNAEKIARLVKVEYSNVKRGITSLEEAIAKELFHPGRFPNVVVGDTENEFSSCDHVIEGEVKSGSQHNFYIEPQTCLIVPQDTGFKVYSTTQCSRLVQEYVSRALGIKASSVDVIVPRLGGGFGGKIEYPSKIACAIAVASDSLNRPVRMTMSLADNLSMVGKRAALISKYKVGFSKDGLLKACNLDIYGDSGISGDNVDGFIASICANNAYFCPNWKIRIIDCKTNTPFNTFVRAPGHLQGMFIGETILDHVASFLQKETPEDVKELNLFKDGQKAITGREISDCLLEKIWKEMKNMSDFDQRTSEILQFNKDHKWKKRGISMMPLLYDSSYFTFNFTTVVSIYYADGTVAVSSGGVEMGQGMNTRVCQVAANQLKIPIDLITIRHHSTVTSPNCSSTGGSLSSELNCLAVHKCCEILNERLRPVREKLPDATWLELIKQCSKEKINLSTQYMFYAPEKFAYAYSSYGAACSEVELDVLTGEHSIVRSDIIFDCGESINPSIDIGQIEGAFVMGIGYWFTEKIVYDDETGKQLTTSTWTYKPPMSKDIPRDFRVRLLHDAVNPIGYVRSKAVGEPGICMASSCLFATKRAIEAARIEFGHPPAYFPLDGPATVDKIQTLCQVQEKDLTI